MSEKNHNTNDENRGDKGRQESIGNQQDTIQTGGQSGGGDNIDQEEDNYTEDLRQSGDRNSSNRKEGS